MIPLATPALALAAPGLADGQGFSAEFALKPRWYGVTPMTDEPFVRMIPLSKLVPSLANVRKTGRDVGIEELAASIVAHGCVSAWNKDPVGGVIGVQTGPH